MKTYYGHTIYEICNNCEVDKWELPDGQLNTITPKFLKSLPESELVAFTRELIMDGSLVDLKTHRYPYLFKLFGYLMDPDSPEIKELHTIIRYCKSSPPTPVDIQNLEDNTGCHLLSFQKLSVPYHVKKYLEEK